ncbi:plasmid stabilization protein [Steroidobacter denitrificans]|uniref:Plasmid stabilization protein n=1 Tax=Steroidobacter denitrificans TaxID=465721 RepID=A0A127FBJ7_STEDE|nr:type II toxin-antitoxin system RelE/ParE family toxin [Steroidobacter denitrificans]AMN47794.1 plasmid stabilization protein [Steroidobacter denitrificans]
MAEIIWTEPALADLDTIADYIALDNPQAARKLVRRVFDHVDQLAAHPLSGSKLSEFQGWRYRQIVEPPCRVIYRHEKGSIHLVHVVRGERLLDKTLLGKRSKVPAKK